MADPRHWRLEPEGDRVTAYPFRPDHADPAVVAHRRAVDAFLSQLDTYLIPEPEPVEIEPCYCEHGIDAHTGPDTECQDCDCAGFAEQTDVRTTVDALQLDDAFNEGRRRDSLPSALRVARRRARVRHMFPRGVA